MTMRRIFLTSLTAACLTLEVGGSALAASGGDSVSAFCADTKCGNEERRQLQAIIQIYRQDVRPWETQVRSLDRELSSATRSGSSEAELNALRTKIAAFEAKIAQRHDRMVSDANAVLAAG
jgi:hypothetical protein